MAIFITIVISGLSSSLAGSITSSLSSVGASVLDPYFLHVSATSALFSAFLGENPMINILSQVNPSVVNSLSTSVIATLESKTWFPGAISAPFMQSLRETFLFGAGISIVAALASSLRGRKYVRDLDKGTEQEMKDSKGGMPSSVYGLSVNEKEKR